MTIRQSLLFLGLLLTVCAILRFGYHPLADHLRQTTQTAVQKADDGAERSSANDVTREVDALSDRIERGQEIAYLNGFAAGRFGTGSYVPGVNKIRQRFGLPSITRSTLDWYRLGVDH